MSRAPLDILELVAIAVGLIAALLVARGAAGVVPGVTAAGLLAAGAGAAAMALLVLARRARRGGRRERA